MKLCFVFCFNFFLLLYANAQSTQPAFSPGTVDEKELVRLTHLMSSVSGSGDSSVYHQYIHPAFVLTYAIGNTPSCGKFMTKSQVIQKWYPKEEAGFSSIATVLKIQITGNTGVVHACIVDKFLNKTGEWKTATSWATDVWIKNKGHWYWFSSHETLVGKE
jgi:hypothetical protein